MAQLKQAKYDVARTLIRVNDYRQYTLQGQG